MNVVEAIKQIRDDYVEQLNNAVAFQRTKRSDVYVDRRLQRPDTKLFGGVYVPDISFGNPMTEWLDLVPRNRSAAIPTFAIDSPALAVEFEDLCWDDVRIDHDGEFTGKLVSWWFHRWMPPVDPLAPRAEGLSGFIHSATVDEKWICVDFGSAAVDALFDILSIAQSCGAKSANVTSTRKEA